MKKEYSESIKLLMSKAIEIDCIPVGAIVVKDGEVIGSGYNKRNITGIVTDHAEIIAINEACRYLNDWRLDGCELYVSLYPCLMCRGAIKESRITNVIYFADRKKTGVVNNNRLTKTIFKKLEDNVGSEEQLKLFFEKMRK